MRKTNKPTNTPQLQVTDGAVTSYYFDAPAGWTRKYFFMSDVHYDSVLCDRELLKDHLERIKKARGRLVIVGDFFDAMQGRFDPRRSMDELRPEYRRDDYYDFVVKDAAEYLKPYAKYIDAITDGNHELSVRKNANTDLIDRLIFMLNSTTGSNILHGGYGGWFRLVFTLADGGLTGRRLTKKIKYYHGSGGDAPVTKGVISTNRQAVYLPDADIVVNGHNHNQYHMVINRERLGNKGSLYFDLQHHIRTPGYKQAYGDGSAGWDVTRGAPPKPLGGAWLQFTANSRGVDIHVTPEVTGGVPFSITNDTIYTGAVYDEDGGDT